MTTFNNDHDYKLALVKEMKKHRKQDTMIRGTYLEINSETEFKGCFIGCAILSHKALKHEVSLEVVDEINRKGYYHSRDEWGFHVLAQEMTGIPRGLYTVCESIFEGLDDFDDAKNFAVDVLEAIPVGYTRDDLKNLLGVKHFGQYLSFYIDYEEDAKRLIKQLKGAKQ